MGLFTVAFRLFILVPIRVVIDLVKWFLKVFVPFISTLLASTPLNIIFLISVFIMVLMYIFPDIVVWNMVLIWEFNRNFLFNIYRVALNIIIQLFYNWWASSWNILVVFIELVFEMVWAGICGGAKPFEQIVECIGFENYLIIFEIIVSHLYEYWVILMGTLALLFQLLNTILGPLTDPLKSKNLRSEGYCDNQACSDWGKFRINPDTGVIINNPGPFRLNLKAMLNEVDVRYVQIYAYIIIASLQWLLLDVIPFFLQVWAFWTDIFRLILFYFQEHVVWAVGVVARIFGAISYIIQRAYKSIINQPSGVIVFDPEFWNMNISEYKYGNQQEIINAYVGEYMLNITNLVLYRIRDEEIGNVDVTNELIRYYGYFYVFMQIVMELPLTILLVIDKFICIYIFFFQCIDFTIACEFLFNPPKTCLVVQRMATNDFYLSQTPDPWYYNYDTTLVWDLYLLSYCMGAGCSFNGSCIPEAPSFCKSGAQFKCGIQPITQLNFGCVDSSFSINPRTGPFQTPTKCVFPYFGINTTCDIDETDGPGIAIPLEDYGSNPNIIVTYTGCNITYNGKNDTCRYCGHYLDLKQSGLLFPDKYTWWNIIGIKIIVVSIDILDVLIDAIAPVDLWAGLYEMGVFFMDTCLDFSNIFGECPCSSCPTEPEQFIRAVDVYFFIPLGFKEWYPCNPINGCCQQSPYYSIIYALTALIQKFDIFNVLGILPPSTEPPFPFP